jgi:hypothetical protein
VLQNSNNNGGVNIIANEVVDVQIGEEYIVDLGFSSRSLTLAEATAVPEPATGLSLGAALVLTAILIRRKRTR